MCVCMYVCMHGLIGKCEREKFKRHGNVMSSVCNLINVIGIEL